MLRIGLLGGECTGKTTLANALAQTLPACVVPERLREFVTERGRAPLREEQHDLLLEQQEAEDVIARSCPEAVLVADPAGLMTAIYSIVYFDDDSLVETAAELALSYDLLLWCDIDLPWTADGIQRDGPEVRDRTHSVIGDIVQEVLTPAGMTVARVSGPMSQRAEAARTAWQLRGSGGPT